MIVFCIYLFLQKDHFSAYRFKKGVMMSKFFLSFSLKTLTSRMFFFQLRAERNVEIKDFLVDVRDEQLTRPSRRESYNVCSL